MRKCRLVLGAILLGLLLIACGIRSNPQQASSSSVIVTHFNGQLHVSTTNDASLVSGDNVPQQLSAATFLSPSMVLAAQQTGAASVILESSDGAKTWSVLSKVLGKVTELDFPTQMNGYVLVVPDQQGGPVETLYRTSDGGHSWSEVFKGAFVTVGFTSPSRGFAVLNNSDTGGSALVTTSDGGKIWKPLAIPLGAQVVTASFGFISPVQGWLLVGYQPGAGSQMKSVFGTKDGGVTWSLVTSSPGMGNSSAYVPAGLLPVSGYVRQIFFVTSMEGYMVLDRGGLFQSRDGGKTWLQMPVSGLGEDDGRNILGFAAWGQDSFSVATNRSSFWKSTVSGSWQRVFPPFRAQGVFFGNDGLYVLSPTGRVSVVQDSCQVRQVQKAPLDVTEIEPVHGGLMAFAPTSIYKSFSGAFWQKVPLPSGWSQIQGSFVSSTSGVIVANPNSAPGSAALEVTVDAGRSWKRIVTGFRPLEVDPISNRSWWVIGGTPTSAGTNRLKPGFSVMAWNLYYTSDGGRNWNEFVANWSSPGGLDFLNSSEGYLWAGNYLYHTTDGGASFTRYLLPSLLRSQGLFTMTFASNGVGWAVPGTSYPIYHTIDGGAHWGLNP